MKKKKIKLCLTKQLLNMFKLWCEWGISIILFPRHAGCLKRARDNSCDGARLPGVGSRQRGVVDPISSQRKTGNNF